MEVGSIFLEIILTNICEFGTINKLRIVAWNAEVSELADEQD